jgi:hypothetical protein
MVIETCIKSGELLNSKEQVFRDCNMKSVPSLQSCLSMQGFRKFISLPLLGQLYLTSVLVIPSNSINKSLSTDNIPFVAVGFAAVFIIYVTPYFLTNMFHNNKKVWHSAKAMSVVLLTTFTVVILGFILPMALNIFPVQFLLWTFGI